MGGTGVGVILSGQAVERRLLMKIVMTNPDDNTRKVVKFGELIRQLQAVNMNVINRKWINYKLLNGETVRVNGNEYKREVN